MITAAGHTLQMGEQECGHCGTRLSRVTLECTCGQIFASQLAEAPTGQDRARIRAQGWPASQAHLLKAQSEENEESGKASPKARQS